MQYVLMFIGIDIVTGLMHAFYTKSFKSEIARQGLYKKGSEVFICAISFLLDKFLIDNGITVSVSKYVLVYVAVMEVLSILENFTFNQDIADLVNKIKEMIGGLLKI